ncbi:ATP-binding protein [Niallia sp. 03133]|uniref:ATP-binding protein n=1 Tax=Niallia sp. 03133 TaxID=3458060 RepID=UPI004044D09E
MQQYNEISQKVYYFIMVSIILLMIAGIMTSFVNVENLRAGHYLHIILVILLSILLLIYPKYDTSIVRKFIMLIGSTYFYGLFYLYPETAWSSFIFICFIPALSILFFDAKLFYFSLFLNGVLYTVMYSCILFAKDGTAYQFMEINIFGNIVNFMGSQTILFFIFQLTFARIKKQQLYNEQLQQSERLKTTGQLAAAVAHEIRNPLTVVKGFLQLYDENTTLDENLKRNFSLMFDELDTAEQVISQFLMVAKPDKDKNLAKIEVHFALKSVTDLIKSYGLLRDNNIYLNIQEDCAILINLIEFKQLMINLIKNAIEASNYGQSVIIQAEKQKNSVEIKIIDHGDGMNEEEIRSLGTPFYSLKSKGTGLGMMICFNIVEKYNGKINIVSTKGEGTTVIIRFPVEK